MKKSPGCCTLSFIKLNIIITLSRIGLYIVFLPFAFNFIHRQLNKQEGHDGPVPEYHST